MKYIITLSIASGLFAVSSAFAVPGAQTISELSKRDAIGAEFCTGIDFTGDCQTFTVPESVCSKPSTKPFIIFLLIINQDELPVSLNDTVQSITPTGSLCYFYV